MGIMNAYDSWRLSEPRGWNDDDFAGQITETIEELIIDGCYIEAPVGWRVAIEIGCADGAYAVERVFYRRDAVTGPHTVIMNHTNGQASCPVWLVDAATAWLATADGKLFCERAVDEAMEAA